MKSYVILMSLSILLAGCGPVVNPDLLVGRNNLYKGYPCFDYCEDFQFGFDRAENRNIKHQKDCQGENESQLLGCHSYVHEFKAENESDLQLLQYDPSDEARE